jgi:hypothetical protein
MIVDSGLAIAAILTLLLLDPSTATLLPNIVQIMPKKWKLWMMGETSNGKTSGSGDVIM